MLRKMPKSHPTNPTDDDEDSVIDFSNAQLYVGGIQAITATVLVAISAVICCLTTSVATVSAVRTLVVSSAVGVVVVRKPFRIGKVHGLILVFRALQPCVGIYVSSLVVEQLTHACATSSVAPPWRRIVFTVCTLAMVFSGFLRARKPLESTDRPFLVTAAALCIAALLPPPAVMATGPLCATPSLVAIAERLVRAFVFALLYSLFVYAAAPPVQSHGEILVCVMRASAASIWVLAAHTFLLPLALVQGVYVVWIRVFSSEYKIDDDPSYAVVATASESDVEASESVVVDQKPVVEPVVDAFAAIGPRVPIDISPGGGGGLSNAEMAELAARIVE
jgi:hypothetical protein